MEAIENNESILKKSAPPFSIKGIHYLTGQPVRILIKDGMIQSIIPLESNAQTETLSIISPGFIDLQVNGYKGVDFSDENLDHKSVKYLLQELWKNGVTSLFATLITNSHKNLLNSFQKLTTLLNEDELFAHSILGFHLEGPFISGADGYRGCHPKAFITNPSIEVFEQYQKASENKISIVTLAPESPGAFEFISYCNSQNILTAIGHTNATSETIRKAVNLGSKLSTHLGNGCANMINRHLNPIWPQLAADQLFASIIADGHHLTRDEIKVFWKVKGPEKLILISDTTSISGLNPGEYTFAGDQVRITKNNSIVTQNDHYLAGAFPTIKTGVENIMNFIGCSLSESLHMASRNVAHLIGHEKIGELKVGFQADIILFEKGRSSLEINETYVRGKKVYSKK